MDPTPSESPVNSQVEVALARKTCPRGGHPHRSAVSVSGASPTVGLRAAAAAGAWAPTSSATTKTDTTCSFDYSDIVTEGFRTIRTGERVRFLQDPADFSHAIYVIRLDLPDVEKYYE